MAPILQKERPHIVLVHGDTTTAYAAATAAFYQQIPVGHVEAGLRIWNKQSPYPEEANRQLIDVLADVHFAPTEESQQNLLKENRDPQTVFVTGNTAIDATNVTIKENYVPSTTIKSKGTTDFVEDASTGNVGQPMIQVFQALARVAKEYPDIHVVFPMYKNPQVRDIARHILGNIDNVALIEPLDVIDFHNVANQSTLILTDSGGVQEEAPSLGVPVLVLRDTTERPEGIAAGTLKLIGTQEEDVYRETERLLDDQVAYQQMAYVENPYGDGRSSQRIVAILAEKFGV